MKNTKELIQDIGLTEANTISIPATVANKRDIVRRDAKYNWNSITDTFDVDITSCSIKVSDETVSGHSFINNNPYLFRIFGMWFLSHNPYTYTRNVYSVPDDKLAVIAAHLEEQMAYKRRYDSLPQDVINRHLALRIQDNPEQYPIATGKGRMEGCSNMGSCQCGDVKWWVEWNCDTLEFSFGNSNWSNRNDFHIPYVGNALDMVVSATNIVSGWKCR